MANTNNYQEMWEQRSSIRTRPRKIIDFKQSGAFFPPDKQPLLLVAEVSALGEQAKHDILLYSFYKYLNDIIGLETKLIATACNKIIYGDLIVSYSDETKLNAHTIIIDEYYHVYVARDMINQLINKFPKLVTLSFPNSDAYNAVATITKKLDNKYRDMFEIIAVCIFETTLVKELVEFFNVPEVHPSIKHYVNDHMNDEAKHYGFFYHLLSFTWANLPIDYQTRIGEQLADFVVLYLNFASDTTYSIEILKHLLHDEEKAHSIVENIYHGFTISNDLPIVKNVLTVLKKTHIMDSNFVKDGFVKNNLYIQNQD